VNARILETRAHGRRAIEEKRRDGSLLESGASGIGAMPLCVLAWPASCGFRPRSSRRLVPSWSELAVDLAFSVLVHHRFAGELKPGQEGIDRRAGQRPPCRRCAPVLWKALTGEALPRTWLRLRRSV
jgi:hypothetical protein